MEDRALRLPRVKPLLHLPVSAIVEIVSNRSEADVLLRIGDLAHEFDELTAYLVQWLEHQQYLKVSCVLAEDPRASHSSSLAPLTCQARAANGRGVALLQQRITDCLQKLQRHADSVRVFADQNASFAQELRLCGLETRADQRRQLAETESALANRLSKFLGGCDSFYDEPPLPLAVRFAAETTAAAAEAAGKAPPPAPVLRENASSDSRMSRQDGEGNSGAGSATSSDGPGSRKRPCPGGLPCGSSHAPRDYIRQKEVEGGVGYIDGGRREDLAAAAATRRGDCVSSLAVNRNHREPAPSLENCGERDERNGGGGGGSAAGERTTDEAGKQLAEDGNNDRFAAPLFLTPPVIAVSESAGRPSRGLRGNGSGGGSGHMVGSAAGATPQSASSSCYSASSTPTNESASPALAVASPAGKAPWRSEGLGQPGLTVAPPRPPIGGGGGGRRKRARGNGSCSSLGGEERGALREENHHSHSACSSPTPPSTREPLSPPPLSTQEGSSPAATTDTAAAVGLAVGDVYGNGVFRGREREVIDVDGSGGGAGNGFGTRRQVERAHSGGADAATRSSAAGSGSGSGPRRTSGVSGFVFRGPKTEVDDRDQAGWECRAGGPAGAEHRGRARLACTGEAGEGGGARRQEEGSSGTVNAGEEEEQEADEEDDDYYDDMVDTADTIEENALGVPAAATPTVAAAAEPGALAAAAAVEEGPDTNRSRRRSREEGGEIEDSTVPSTRGGGTGSRNRARDFSRRQAKVEASQESEGSEEAFSWFGSQGQSGGGIKLEAGGTGA